MEIISLKKSDLLLEMRVLEKNVNRYDD